MEPYIYLTDFYGTKIYRTKYIENYLKFKKSIDKILQDFCIYDNNIKFIKLDYNDVVKLNSTFFEDYYLKSYNKTNFEKNIYIIVSSKNEFFNLLYNKPNEESLKYINLTFSVELYRTFINLQHLLLENKIERL